jgi:hypothetical protein
MALSLAETEARIAALKAELRSRGHLVRYTEWPLGHQVVLHARDDPSRAIVTEWMDTELEAWEEALRIATQPAEEDDERPGAPH